MKTNKNALILGALSGLMLLGGCSAMGSKTAETSDQVMCYGVNSCKGQGACAGKIDACSGKNACNAEVTCAGQNSCKGKGLIKLSKKECLDQGGKIASK
ncbi:MAG: hypothetical protein K2P81_11725 [Bacteriovoracaceae bacterium]|nr:hypothetical protein [Bacteriovoracaceae bacterium]